jgi:glycerol uptake facilitator-like aquaporin
LATSILVFGLSSIFNPEKYEIHALCAVFLLFAICISGSLTGANINPSVTLSNYLRKENKYTLKMIPVYFAGQLLGVILALFIARYVNNLNQPG